MAFPDRQWARSWRKFVQDSFWLDSLQIGQLLLLVLALITLLFLLMFSFCCCFPRNKRRRPPQKRGSNQQLLANNWHRTPQTASFRTSNEERRRLLPPSYAATNLQNCRSSSLQQPNENEQMLADGKIVVENDRIEDAEEKNTMPPIATNCSTSPALATHHFVKHGQTPSGTPLSVTFRKPPPPHLVEQSPPPPRRLAPPGGKTQVLPLTNSNRKRVPALMLLMADQETQQKPKTPSSGRSAGTPESRTTTTAAKSCETIPEDPEVDISASEELMSIDRTLISASTVTAQPQTICQFQPRSSFRLASPFPQPPPKFEILPPSYSPPEPPTESICPIAQNNNAAADGSTTRSNLSSPDQSSYGGQTPLNTTTGSSESVIHQGDDGKIRISELEYSDIGRSGIGGGTVAEMEALDGCWPTVASTVESQIQPSLPSILANLPANRVPRSISQQLELMEEMAAAKNRAS